jgi:rhamnogalacturonan endolyase
MNRQRRFSILLCIMVLTILAVGFPVVGLRQAKAVSAASHISQVTPVSLTVSGMTATITNGLFTVKFNSSGIGYSLVRAGEELIGTATGLECTVNGYTIFSPTKLTVVTNTPTMVDIAYTSTWGDLHYVARSGVSGLYSYFVATGIGTVGEFRTVDWMDGNLFHTAYNGIEDAIALPTLSQINASKVIQDATYQLADGTIYTKYDASTYVDQDLLHGIYNNNQGIWMISPSHEYNNGGPLKQDLTAHMDAGTGDGIVLNMLVSSHFGTPSVTIPAKKIYGPWLLYFNNGSIADAQAQANTESAAWPYTWLSNPNYPLARTTVTATLRLADGRPAAGATVSLAQPGGDIYSQGAGYIYSTQADANGHILLRNVRPGSYSLYAWANGGSIGDVTDQFEHDTIRVSGAAANLGTLTWSPPTYAHLLWQIGTADHKADEFKLSNLPRAYDLFKQVPANLTYTIGKSTPRNNWYYAQTVVGNWNVNFNLAHTYTGTAHLTVAIAGASRTPTVQIKVNGTTVTTLPGYVNDQAIYRSANQSGTYHLALVTFPASRLKAGNNTITFDATTVSSGGGVMYDTIKLEAD